MIYISSVVEADRNIQQTDEQDIGERLQYPSTPKEFQSFNRLKDMKYKGIVMTSNERCGLYWDRASQSRNGRFIPYFPQMYVL